MKKFLLFLTSFVFVGTMMARQLTPDEALALAMGKMNAAQPERSIARGAGANAARPSLTHTETTDQDVPLYYVYNFAEGGFLIASADDRVSSLLGYTDDGDFDGAKQNLSFMAWLKDCRMVLSHIDDMPEQTLSTSDGARALTAPVKPLLGKITWNQGAPYNLLTPMCVGYPYVNAEPDTVHAPTGCAATAVAQIMMYHQWPVIGTGSHTNMNDSTQTVDFSQSTYQWSKMLPAYQGGESEESRMAVAQLMCDVGCALDMDYGYNGSGTSIDAAIRALTTYFGYDKSLRLLYRNECSSEEWNELLQTELNEQRPVLFRANAVSGGGHQFVVDGYDTNALYHVNWGWGGMGNGYFDMNLMDPDFQGIGGYDGGYTISQGMVLGLKPDVAGTSVAKPELVMTKHFTFDSSAQQWSYIVRNYGLGDFTGETGIAMESPTGEVTKVMSFTFDDEPFLFFGGYIYRFPDPEVPGPGYKLYPYYCDEIGGEMKRVATLYNGAGMLQSVEMGGEYTWNYVRTAIPAVKVESVEVKHNFVGFDPQFNIILSNPITAIREYTGDIAVEIYKIVDGEEVYVGKGTGQAFIMPGESQEIVVRCNNIKEEFKGKIKAGVYRYHLNIGMGGTYYRFAAANFRMVTTPPSDIYGNDFGINKHVFRPGEELTACMTVINDGGFDMKTLAFVVFRQLDSSLVEAIELRNFAIEQYSIEPVQFKKVLDYNPGVYMAGFFVGGKQLWGAPILRFAVGYPMETDLDKLLSEPADDAKSDIYDLQGRPVQQMRKGSLYIGKDKVIVK